MPKFTIGIAELSRKKKKNTQEKEEDPNGQGLVEYALILFLVAVVVIAILILLGPQIGSVFSAITKGLGSPSGCANPNPAGQCPPGQQ